MFLSSLYNVSIFAMNLFNHNASSLLNRYGELWNENHGILFLILQYKCPGKTLNIVYIWIMNIMTPTHKSLFRKMWTMNSKELHFTHCCNWNLEWRLYITLLKDSTSDYDTLLTKCGVDSFRISSLKSMAVEIYKIFNEMSPEYLSLCSKSSIPYSLRDNNKLIQQKNENDHIWIKVFYVLWCPFMEFIASRYKKCREFGKFQNTCKELAGSFVPPYYAVCQLVI